VLRTQAYQALVDKHSQLAREHRLLLEHAGDAAVSNQVEELLAVRQQLAELLPRYDEARNKVAELRWASGPGVQVLQLAFAAWCAWDTVVVAHWCLRCWLACNCT
jgi:hypothetical protein